VLDLSKKIGFEKVNIKTNIRSCIMEYGVEYEGVKIISANERFVVLETSEDTNIILAINAIQCIDKFIKNY